jgi:hypothetical protein
LVITETWLQSRLPPSTQFHSVQSPHSPNQGIAIWIRQDRVASVKHVHEELWTPELIIIEAEITTEGKEPRRATIIGAYLKPGTHADSLKYLKWILANLNHQRARNLILLGDFNLGKEDFSGLARSFNLTHILPTDPGFSSRVGNNGQASFIDHIATSGFPEVLYKDDTLQISDHRLIWTKFSIDKPTEPIPRTTKHVLRKLDDRQKKRILFHRHWPKKPFIRVARGLGMTRPILEATNQFNIVKRAIVQAKATVEDVENLNRDLLNF